MHHKHRVKGYIILILLLAATFFLGRYSSYFRQFASPEYVRDYLLGLGNWGYVMYVILFILSIPLPIPSVPIAIGGGYVYGVILGTFLTMIGMVLGSSIPFYLARKYGRPLLEKFVSKHHLAHFTHLFRKRGINAAIVSYALPIFPSDALNLMLGMSKIRYHTFLLIVALGTLPRYLIVTALGEDLHAGFSLRTGIILALAVIFVLIAVFRKAIEHFLFKELRYVEHEVEKEAHFFERGVRLLQQKAGVKKWEKKLRKS